MPRQYKYSSKEEAVEANRVKARNTYRKKHGISLDAPKYTRAKLPKEMTDKEIQAKNEANKVKARNAYRLAHGIPLDAPKYTHAKSVTNSDDTQDVNKK